jgi:hypothetical protein
MKHPARCGWLFRPIQETRSGLEARQGRCHRTKLWFAALCTELVAGRGSSWMVASVLRDYAIMLQRYVSVWYRMASKCETGRVKSHARFVRDNLDLFMHEAQSPRRLAPSASHLRWQPIDTTKMGIISQKPSADQQPYPECCIQLQRVAVNTPSRVCKYAISTRHHTRVGGKWQGFPKKAIPHFLCPRAHTAIPTSKLLVLYYIFSRDTKL